MHTLRGESNHHDDGDFASSRAMMEWDSSLTGFVVQTSTLTILSKCRVGHGVTTVRSETRPVWPMENQSARSTPTPNLSWVNFSLKLLHSQTSPCGSDSFKEPRLSFWFSFSSTVSRRWRKRWKGIPPSTQADSRQVIKHIKSWCPFSSGFPVGIEKGRSPFTSPDSQQQLSRRGEKLWQ